MRILNLDLLKNIILPGLLGSSVWSALIAIVVGSVIGLIIGAIKRHFRQASIGPTMLSAIAGCFFGTMLLFMLPILSTPGVVGGGAYGGIWILQLAVFALPVGAIGGSIIGGLAGVPLFKKYNRRLALLLLVGTYSFMAIVSYTTISAHCSKKNTLPDYCSQAGYAPFWGQPTN